MNENGRALKPEVNRIAKCIIKTSWCNFHNNKKYNKSSEVENLPVFVKIKKVYDSVKHSYSLLIFLRKAHELWQREGKLEPCLFLVIWEMDCMYKSDLQRLAFDQLGNSEKHYAKALRALKKNMGGFETVQYFAQDLKELEEPCSCSTNLLLLQKRSKKGVQHWAWSG